MIQLHFDKLYSGERLKEHCQTAIPFPKGKLFSADGLKVIQNDTCYPSQYQVTSRWEDGSIRWLHLRFLADLPSNKACDCFLLLPEEKSAATEVPTATNQLLPSSLSGKEALTVSTGALRFTVAAHSSQLLWDVKQTLSDCDYSSYHFPLPLLMEETSSPEAPLRYDTELLSWKVLEHGPLLTILEAEALLRPQTTLSSLQKELRAQLRLTAYAGKPWLEMEYRLMNTTEDELHIASLTWSLTDTCDSQTLPAPVRTCAAHSNYQTQFHTSDCGESMSQLIDSQLLLYEANEHFAEVFYGTLFCDRSTQTEGLCATVFQGQQNYPKAVEASSKGLCISLVPQCEDKVSMESGMARCQRVLLHFHAPDEELASLNNRSTIYQMPDRCHLAPEIFHQAEVFEDVFPSQKDPNFEKVLSLRADGHSRCYGMMNWGDSPDPGYTMQGRGGNEPVWTNNEYDYPHACYLLYARTGIRRFLDYGLVAADHWMDVDVCHYSKDPLLLGGQWEHTNRHCKNGHMYCSHEWVEGLLDTWHFTGNPRALETALGIGENVLRLLDTPMFHQKGGINARETGWALRTLVALYKETGDEKWLQKCDWIVGHFTEWKEEYGQWLSPYLDNVAIHVVFMISIAVGSLMRYYRIRPNQHIKDMIVDAVDDMVENCMLDDGTFYYKELPSLSRTGTNTLILEALQNAYELTGNVDYLKTGLVTFQNALKSGGKSFVSGKKHIGDAIINQGDGTKNFAQSFLPLALYYKAASDNRLL
ncbi:MAG: glycoside hydrolase family 127 protein [bacterium]|nr:glycoside hydrolase family 127 protein [bacterium]